MADEEDGKRPKRGLIAGGGVALLVGAGALAWALVQPGRPEADAPSPPAAEAPAPSAERSSVDRLMAARRAAFPDGPIVQDGPVRVTFTESRLVDAPFGPVLLSEGRIADATHVDAGRIAVHYLRATSDGFAVRQAFPLAVETGSLGRLSSWEVSDRFTRYPVLRTEGGGTWQGITCAVVILTELTPEGPREIAVAPIALSTGGAVMEERGETAGGEPRRTLEGRIANVRQGQGFDMIFSGTENFTESYVYRDGRFTSATGDSRASC